VKLIRNSKNLSFNQTEKMIENITQGEETEIAFTFDVDYNIGKTEADTGEFMITDDKSVYLTKQFILQYALPTEYKLEQIIQIHLIQYKNQILNPKCHCE
jgi:hypothetical protein